LRYGHIKKPGKRELIISLLIFGGIAIVITASFASQSAIHGSPAEFGTAASAPGLFYNGVNLNPSNVPSSSYSVSAANSVNNARVVNTSEALVGELNHGSFEHVTGEIISNLTTINGHVASSNLMYNGTTWLGIYQVDVPSGNATAFLFQVKDLVDSNGKTTSVQISTVDVTNETGGNQSKVPFSSFGMTLQEMALAGKSGGNPQVNGVFSNISGILFSILDGAAYVVLIGVPLYLLILGGVLVSSRILYPMLSRVTKSDNTKKDNPQL
jgi:hypothetical protein